MIRSEMVQRAGRSYISPSIATDHATETRETHLPKFLTDWTNAPKALAGLWLFRRFPKTTVLALTAWGAYSLYQTLGAGKDASTGDTAEELH